eukprot:CAMPEP_0172444826 /NCGR_PEP_ID=MMETSP1065-20121228/4825_1 /TAXON_ID=265537 /ORGANISM="Amphiprora paludosa, Strain CCMP125" /LENGTH=1178 /DNA_ID=CAMNT_0013195527 /DNA_START=75 /DNA_END=3611 /DNA_ORIENTATION=+
MMRDNDTDDASELLSVSEFSQEDEDNTSSHDDGSDAEHHQKKKKKKKGDEIGTKESKSVFRAKLMVYLVLVVSCVTASVLTYFFTSDQETDDFEKDFKVFADEIVRVANDVLQVKIDVVESLSISTTSYATKEGHQFPFVTLPDFEIQTQKAREMASSELILMTPLVDKTAGPQWENYTKFEGSWIEQGLVIQGLPGVNPGPIPGIHDLEESDHHNAGLDQSSDDADSARLGVYAPIWQTGPAPINASIVNSDFLSDETFAELAEQVVRSRLPFVSRMGRLPIAKYFANLGDTLDSPYSFVLSPIFKDFNENADIVGLYYIVVPWDIYFRDILPLGVGDIEVVVSDSCDGVVTYAINGPNSWLKSRGDTHNSGFDNLRVTGSIDIEGQDADNEELCHYTLQVYPTKSMKSDYESQDPLIFAIVVAFIFVFTTMVFLVYDWAVQRRQWMIIRAARKTQAIVSSLFPKNVQDRIMKDVDEEVQREANAPFASRGNRTKDQLQNFLKGKEGEKSDEGDEDVGAIGPKRSKPIADLFPEATIIFADIVGFTAWSSTREPSQVFQLLETIYHVFDEIANRRRVFKVETVGDCYVAVAGLPEPRKDHAIVMARFARDCLGQFTQTVKAMVVELGPDTEELGLRIGLHSGPVTAGVLRGERARFQLFGDTVNTTARMESTGLPNKVHISQETADLLTAAGKSAWLRTRRETVVAKGKGELQTYWLESTGEANTVTTAGESDVDDSKEQTDGTQSAPNVAPAAPAVPSADKYNRLVAWNCDILAKLLTQIVARRESRNTQPDTVSEIRKLEEQYCSNRYVLSEVQEIVRLPKFEAESQRVDPWSVQLSEDVLGQLKDYVQTLAAMYRDNPFHNFEHASHVTMSVMKLLSRIVAPDMASSPSDTDEALHDHTYGITSDPMTQFAVALSALIHDVDHPGVPNSQLIKEETSLAAVYRNKSIAEQNSVDLAWDLLMDDAYGDLRNTIYVTKTEFLRFRQLVVNIVLATDIMDKDLGALRKGRWNRAFSEQASNNTEDDVNRKATIVMEHLIQASDVAHTMQHWHIYRKWNQRLFKEMYEAFLSGRAEKDPSENWYDGEKGFFDFYIIPLAKKLKDCGVFGVSSDEYLQYAVQNRKEWDLKGQELVAEMLKSFRDQGRIPGAKAAAAGSAPEQAPPRQASAVFKKEKELV